MRRSALNIWKSRQERAEQQAQEVKENSEHPKMVWKLSEHQDWGDAIRWDDVKTGRMSGHTTPLPREGDELWAPMASGKMGRFQFVKVEPCYDPSDMWFGSVVFVGYVEEQR